ncbi:ATP-binding protein [Aliarcobacter butzleri]|uniref:ATP-binding protein n=1 Tax=Aliarcobacter butzleri TaxID=28197 RepID=UPI003AF3A9B4
MAELVTYNNLDPVTEIKFDKTIQNFLERNFYETYDVKQLEQEENKNIDFVKINHISYDRNKDETDINLVDFEQILSAISSKSGKFVYIIESSQNGVDFYLGTQKESKEFLNDTFQGVYSGSLTSTNNKPKFDENSKFSKAMLGIPSLKRNSDKKYNQSLEKILFPMQGKSFRIVIVAESYNNSTIKEIISNYQNFGNELHKFVKQSKNMQESNANSEGITITTGETNTKGSSISDTDGSSESNSYTKGTGDKAKSAKFVSMGATLLGTGIGMVFGPLGAMAGGFVAKSLTEAFASKTVNESTSNSYSTNKSRTNSTNESISINNSESTNASTSKTKTLGITFDEISKSAEYCEKLVDKYIERFQKGLNHGMWNSSLYIQSNDEITLSELEHTLKSVYSGDETYFEAIRFSENLNDNKNIKIENLPMLYFDKSFKHPIHSSFSGFSSAINSEELSILSALPNNDIDGVSVSKVSSFGLTQAIIDKYNSIEIGNVLNKKKATNQRFKLFLDGLNSHLFVSGITGGGKSNTIKGILEELQSSKNLENKIPFLVIEPAKSEYKHLLKKIPNLQIFRPGAKGDIFRFNPFIFEHSRNNSSVTLTKHVDMLKTTFCSAFPMYGPMPYILEEAIHKVYEKKGWSFETEDHPYFTDLEEANYDRKSLLFPNMEDLKEEVERVVDNAGYYQDLQNNIKAALKTRINNLTLGVKGKIFNSKHNFSSKLLFENPTIIELSNIVYDEEKAFLMGLILNKLYAYKEEKGSKNKLSHITVIEEAHRLLPNISLDKSGEEASARAKAIETFTNILAEIRAYGEGIIIADQIASKLNRDVIKNTNIKIVHRTMDYEDREIVGKAINLSDEQILDIAELKSGEAIVHNKDIHQAFMVKIDEFKEEKISDYEIVEFYNRFIEKNEDYKYELFFEKWFYIENGEKPDFSKINFDILKVKFIEFINSIFFDSKNILENWEKLKKEIGSFKNENSYLHIISKLWNELNFLSNIQYYKDIDSYIESSKTFIVIVLSIIHSKEDLNVRLGNFKEYLIHSNLATIYPSMKNYKSDDIDYTLLLLENITSNEEIYEFVNETMKEDTALNDRLDKILQKIFKTTSPQLRHSLGAIRGGKKEIYFTTIVKEGF